MPDYRVNYYSPLQGYREGEQYAAQKRQNALAEQSAQQTQQFNALKMDQAQKESDQFDAQQAHARISQALTVPHTGEYLSRFDPEIAQDLMDEHGIDVRTADDQTVKSILQQYQAHLAGDAGIAPAAPITAQEIGGMNVLSQGGKYVGSSKVERPYSIQTQAGPNGSTIVTDGSSFRVVDAPQPKPGSRFVALTPAEIEAAGLPAGTSAQRDVETGKIDILSKRDNTGALSQKDATTAKMKLNTVVLAKKQLAAIRQAFESGREGLNAFGPVQGLLPTQAGKLFDQRVNQMRSTLTALTRVPGVGAMSDYETKLDQSKFPSRTNYESVTADQIQQLDDMLSLIENGYRGLLDGQASASAPAIPAASPQQSAPPAAIEYLKENPQFKGAFKQKYGYLPPGM